MRPAAAMPAKARGIGFARRCSRARCARCWLKRPSTPWRTRLVVEIRLRRLSRAICLVPVFGPYTAYIFGLYVPYVAVRVPYAVHHARAAHLPSDS